MFIKSTILFLKNLKFLSLVKGHHTIKTLIWSELMKSQVERKQKEVQSNLADNTNTKAN